MSTEHTNPPAPSAAPSSQPQTGKYRWRLPDPSAPIDAVVYAFLGALLLWVGNVLVQHIHIYWR